MITCQTMIQILSLIMKKEQNNKNIYKSMITKAAEAQTKIRKGTSVVKITNLMVRQLDDKELELVKVLSEATFQEPLQVNVSEVVTDPVSAQIEFSRYPPETPISEIEWNDSTNISSSHSNPWKQMTLQLKMKMKEKIRATSYKCKSRLGCHHRQSKKV